MHKNHPMVMSLRIEICCFEACIPLFLGLPRPESAYNTPRRLGRWRMVWEGLAAILKHTQSLHSPEGMLQGSLHYQPKPMHYWKGEIPDSDHTFPSFDRPKWVPFNDPCTFSRRKRLSSDTQISPGNTTVGAPEPEWPHYYLEHQWLVGQPTNSLETVHNGA